MGILDGLFRSKKERKETEKIDWIQLTSIEQLEKLKNTSVLFKHSTRCGISSSVIKRFESQSSNIEGEIDFFYLDLLNFREISAAIAEKYKVVHQSPQLLVIKDQKMVANGSHYDILEIDLKKFI
jgi:bacillithiol system protein YtxJ